MKPFRYLILLIITVFTVTAMDGMQQVYSPDNDVGLNTRITTIDHSFLPVSLATEDVKQMAVRYDVGNIIIVKDVAKTFPVSDNALFVLMRKSDDVAINGNFITKIPFNVKGEENNKSIIRLVEVVYIGETFDKTNVHYSYYRFYSLPTNNIKPKRDYLYRTRINFV